MKKILVWDLPLRLFHWALVILVTVSFYTGLTGGLTLMDYHMLSGYSILTLVGFRIAWGFLGPRYAKFSSFVRGPRTLLVSARHFFDRGSEPAIGHNPLGGLSVLAMLVTLLLQACTGLFANDDIFVEGPLMPLVSEDTSDFLTEIHEANFWVIATLIGLHIAVIAFSEIYKRQRLVMPMIAGAKTVTDDSAEGAYHRLFLALILLFLSAAAVYLVVN